MRVGIIGTGAVSHKHAQAYANIGYQVTACTDFTPENGRAFAQRHGCEFVPTYQELCRRISVSNLFNSARTQRSTCKYKSRWPPIWKPRGK